MKINIYKKQTNKTHELLTFWAKAYVSQSYCHEHNSRFQKGKRKTPRNVLKYGAVSFSYAANCAVLIVFDVAIS